MGKITEEGVRWLRANYPKKSKKECAQVLMVHISTVSKFIRLLNLDSNQAVDVKQPKLSKGYCLDCEHYISGGDCSKTHRATGALNEKLCFKPKEQ
jgi:hypothetical protein